MTDNKVAKNYFFNASYQILALIVPLITTPYISRVLQANGIGIYSYTYSIVSYFTLCAVLGTATYGNRIFGILQDKIVERTQRFWDVLSLRIITSLIALGVYWIYIFLFAENKWIAGIQSIYIVAVMFDISWYFQGLEEFKKIAVRNYIFKLVNIIYTFSFVKKPDDLWIYVFGLAFLTLLGNISIWIYLPKYIVKIKKYRPKPFHDIKEIVQLFIPSAAIQIYAMLDKSMLGWFTSTSVENGYYEQSEKIVKMCLMLITSLSTVMIPGISKAYAEKRKEDLLNGIYNSYNFVWFLSVPLMFGVIGVAPILTPVFFGNGFDKVEILLPIFSILFVVMGINSTTGSQYYIPTGQQKTYTYSVIIGGAVNIVLNLMLIPRLFSIGAAISSVVGEIAIMIIELMYIQKSKQFEVKKIFLLSIEYMMSGLMMFIYIFIMRNLLPCSAMSLAFLIISAAIMYFAVLAIQREKIVLEVLNLIGKKGRGL